MQLLLQKHSLESLATGGQTMTSLIDPTLATLGSAVYCEAGWSDGAYVTGGPDQNHRDRNGTKTKSDDATNKTHDSG